MSMRFLWHSSTGPGAGSRARFKVTGEPTGGAPTAAPCGVPEVCLACEQQRCAGSATGAS